MRGSSVADNGTHYLRVSIASFKHYKRLAERALEQVSDESFFQDLDSHSNSLAIIVKHIAGNQRSRWTDFLTTDGEKPDRQRDREFLLEEDSRESLMHAWEKGWDALFETLESLRANQLQETITIRTEAFTVLEAIDRQMNHCAYHIGQIVFLARHFAGEKWQSLSVPQGESAEFNKFVADRISAGKPRRHALQGTADFSKRRETEES